MLAQNLGICSTCNYVDICFHRQRHNDPVWYCNEFDNYGKTNEDFKARSTSLHSRYEKPQEDTLIFKGLCSNCEKRQFCNFPKPESGVWHCNEYE